MVIHEGYEYKRGTFTIKILRRKSGDVWKVRTSQYNIYLEAELTSSQILELLATEAEQVIPVVLKIKKESVL